MAEDRDIVEDAILRAEAQLSSGREDSKFEPEEASAEIEEPEEDSTEALEEQELSGQGADVEETEESATEEPSDFPIEAPTFWPADKKAIFAKAPRELQQAFLEVDAQRNDYVNRLARESERGKLAERRASEVFEPYKLKLQANGISDPFQATERLLAWNELFEKDPLTGILDLMRKNNLTPQDLINGESTGYQEEQTDPRIEALRQEVEQAKQSAETLRTQIEQQNLSSLKSEIENFKLGKDSTGQIRRPFAELYAPQITRVTELLQQQNQDAPILQVLNDAYEYVLKEVRSLHGDNRMTPSPQQEVQRAKKAQAAASSVNGAPSKGTLRSTPKAKTIDEALDMAFEAVYGK